MCLPKAPKIEPAKSAAPPPAAPAAAPELAFNEPTDKAARSTKVGRMTLRTDARSPGIKLPKMKSVV